MSAISQVLKSQASSITGNAIDAALSVGKAALNAVMPDDIEYYLCSLELYNQDKKRVGFLSFVVMPDQMEENHSPIQTMIKTHRGIATVLNDSFAPVDISFSGTFGRKWRLLSSFKDPKLELDTKGFLNLSFGSVAGIGVGLKSGYGITKIMEHILQRSYKTQGGKPFYLIFNNYALNTSYVCDVVNYSVFQDIGSNMMWGYSVHLRAVAENATFFKMSTRLKNLKDIAAMQIANGLTNVVSNMIGF